MDGEDGGGDDRRHAERARIAQAVELDADRRLETARREQTCEAAIERVGDDGQRHECAGRGDVAQERRRNRPASK